MQLQKTANAKEHRDTKYSDIWKVWKANSDWANGDEIGEEFFYHKLTPVVESAESSCGLTLAQYTYLRDSGGVFDESNREEWKAAVYPANRLIGKISGQTPAVLLDEDCDEVSRMVG